MKRRLFLFLFLTLVLYNIEALACQCPVRGIASDAETAYDFVIGKVISATPEKLSCSEFDTDVSFEFDVEYSYKGLLKGKMKLFGGQGGGSCGGILHENYSYLVVVDKCDDALYTTMCRDNAFLTNASSQIDFLNKRFDRDYGVVSSNFLAVVVLASLLVLSTCVLITFKYYKKRWTNKKRGGPVHEL